MKRKKRSPDAETEATGKLFEGFEDLEDDEVIELNDVVEVPEPDLDEEPRAGREEKELLLGQEELSLFEDEDVPDDDSEKALLHDELESFSGFDEEAGEDVSLSEEFESLLGGETERRGGDREAGEEAPREEAGILEDVGKEVVEESREEFMEEPGKLPEEAEVDRDFLDVLDAELDLDEDIAALLNEDRATGAAEPAQKPERGDAVEERSEAEAAAEPSKEPAAATSMSEEEEMPVMEGLVEESESAVPQGPVEDVAGMALVPGPESEEEAAGVPAVSGETSAAPTETDDWDKTIDALESRLASVLHQMVEAKLPEIVKTVLQEEIEKLKAQND